MSDSLISDNDADMEAHEVHELFEEDTSSDSHYSGDSYSEAGAEPDTSSIALRNFAITEYYEYKKTYLDEKLIKGLIEMENMKLKLENRKLQLENEKLNLQLQKFQLKISPNRITTMTDSAVSDSEAVLREAYEMFQDDTSSDTHYSGDSYSEAGTQQWQETPAMEIKNLIITEYYINKKRCLELKLMKGLTKMENIKLKLENRKLQFENEQLNLQLQKFQPKK